MRRRFVKTGLLALFVLLVFGGGFWVWDWKNYPLPKFIEEATHPFAAKPGPKIYFRIVEGRRVLRGEKQLRQYRGGWKHLIGDLSFSGRYGSVENIVRGRWFLFFEPDGRITTAFPKQTGKNRYEYHDRLKYGDRGTVDLHDIFRGHPTYSRPDDSTLVIKNDFGVHRFGLTILQDFKGDRSLPHPNLYVLLQEKGGEKRDFTLWFHQAWCELKFGRCEDVRRFESVE